MDIINNLHKGYLIDKTSIKGDGIIYKCDSINDVNKQKVSIKSFLDSDFSFQNTSKGTGIVYKITDLDNAQMHEEHFKQVNSIMSKHKYIDRIAKLIELGYNVEFHAYDDSTFKLNLQVIDSDLPEIIAYIVKDKYK